MTRRLNNISLLGSTALARVKVRPEPWSRQYRPLRDPEGHTAAGTQGSGADNSGGNSDGAGSESSRGNNGGQSFDLSGFWQSPEGSGSEAASKGESAGSKESQSSGQPQTQQQQQQPNPTVEAIKNLDFGKGVMTAQVMKDLSEGKTDGFHDALNQFGRTAVEQSLRTVLPIMQQLRDQMYGEIDKRINGVNQTRDNMKDLYEAIPSANNPALRPQVENIFNRAMTHTKGDRKAAIDMTKDMLRLTATSMDGDLGIPPRSAGDGTAAQPSKTNWLDELAGR